MLRRAWATTGIVVIWFVTRGRAAATVRIITVGHRSKTDQYSLMTDQRLHATFGHELTGQNYHMAYFNKIKNGKYHVQ